MRAYYLHRSLSRSGKHLMLNWIHLNAPEIYIEYNSFSGFNVSRLVGLAIPPVKADKFLLDIEHPTKIPQGVYSSIWESIKQFDSYYDVYLIRDPLNWASSIMGLLCLNHLGEKLDRNMVLVGKVYKLFLERDYWNLWDRAYGQFCKSQIRIKYNNFICDISCRKSLASKLDIGFCENMDSIALCTLASRTGVNHRSSFDQDNVDNGVIVANQMKTLERWKIISGLDMPKKYLEIATRDFGLQL